EEGGGVGVVVHRELIVVEGVEGDDVVVVGGGQGAVEEGIGVRLFVEEFTGVGVDAPGGDAVGVGVVGFDAVEGPECLTGVGLGDFHVPVDVDDVVGEGGSDGGGDGKVADVAGGAAGAGDGHSLGGGDPGSASDEGRVAGAAALCPGILTDEIAGGE